MQRLFGLGALVLFLSGCGSKSSPTTPTTPSPTPTPAAPTVTGLTISGGSGTARTGQTQSLSANVTLSNGTTQAATSPSWSSSNTTVASVSNSGVVTASNQGTTTISVSAQGQTASMPLAVWQDYQGTWQGQYRVRVCTATGIIASAGWCDADLFGVGSSFPVRLILTQQNGTTVSGTIELGEVVGNLRGTVYDSRHFVGAGSASATVEGLLFTHTIGTFDALSTATTLSGTFIWTAVIAGISGQGYNEVDLAGITRTSAGVTLKGRQSPSFGSMRLLMNGMRSLP